MSDKLRLALVGCGAISPMHLFGIEQGAPRIEIAAAVDVDRSRAETLAKKVGLPADAVYTTLDEALEKGAFEAVDLMLPHHLHEAAALRAFDARKHVLLEKPMAPDPESCERILAAARRAGTVFMVAENAQYWPEVVAAKELVEAGAIGELVTARASIFFPPMPAYYGESAWRFDAAVAGGGVAIDTGSHWLRPLRMWLGEVDEVVAALGRPFEKMQGESLVRALLRHEDGRVSTFDALLTEAPLAPEHAFRLTGSAGEIVVSGIGGVTLHDRENPRGRAVGEKRGYVQSYPPEFADFAAAVLDDAALAAGPESSLGELRAALAMVRSAETGRWEKVWR